MKLQPLQKSDFDFSGKISVDTKNVGFTMDELKKIDDERSEAKGINFKFWEKDRTVPPEIENLKSEFGIQPELVLLNLEDVALASAIPLEGQIKAMANRFNFFMMRCGVYINPDDGEKFKALKYSIQYKQEGVATHSMFPGPKQKMLFKVGGQVELGVTGKAEFGFPEIQTEITKIGASAKAAADAKFIVSFDYEYKCQEIDAFGAGTSFCKWIMYNGQDLRNDVMFYPIIRTPKAVQKFDCVVKAYFKISNKDWLRSELFEKESKTITVGS